MWELDHKESWVLKNWCFWTMVLEKTLESHLDSKEIKPVNPKGNQSWIFIGRTDAEAETPILWPPDAKSQLIRKDPNAGKDWKQEEKGMTEDEMVGWYHQLDGHALGLGDGQGSCIRAAVHGVAKSWAQVSNWTDLSQLFWKMFMKWSLDYEEKNLSFPSHNWTSQVQAGLDTEGSLDKFWWWMWPISGHQEAGRVDQC